MNFFIGPNNAGKSVVLNLIHDRLPFGQNGKAAPIDQNSPESYRGAESGQCVCAFGNSISQIKEKFDEKINPQFPPELQLEMRNGFALALKVFGCEGHVWQMISHTEQGHVFGQTRTEIARAAK